MKKLSGWFEKLNLMNCTRGYKLAGENEKKKIWVIGGFVIIGLLPIIIYTKF